MNRPRMASLSCLIIVSSMLVSAGAQASTHAASASLEGASLEGSTLEGSSLEGTAKNNLSAYESVEQSTRQLLARLQEVRPLYESDPERFFTEVQNTLLPYIDLEGFAKGVMAKYYKRATPAQRQAFQDKFRESLIRTYATAIVSFEYKRLVVIPPDRPPKRPHRETIKVEIHALSGNVYPLQYLMVEKEGKWLLRNILVNGINMGLQFRSQFSGYMQQHNQDIDRVISQWSF